MRTYTRKDNSEVFVCESIDDNLKVADYATKEDKVIWFEDRKSKLGKFIPVEILKN